MIDRKTDLNFTVDILKDMLNSVMQYIFHCQISVVQTHAQTMVCALQEDMNLCAGKIYSLNIRSGQSCISVT